MASMYRVILTAEMETKLLAYTLVLCLRLNDYSIPIEEFAIDLSIDPKRYVYPVLNRIKAHARVQIARDFKELG